MSRGGSLALVVMAFLAVLKEGFETSVFLLAAAQTSQGNRWLAVLGGAAGIAVSIGIGVGLYVGGLKLNIGRFFRVTGVFLVLIAAGLVLTALRTAHEGGWVTIGQQQVFNFASWMPANSLRGALITGLFGIPADPRLVEVLGWLLYAVPVLVVFLWPARFGAAPHTRRRLLAGTAAALLIGAAILAIMVPNGDSAPAARARTVTDRVGHPTSVSLSCPPDGCALSSENARIALTAAGDDVVGGVPVRVWQATVASDPGGAPTVTLAELAKLTGGRLPVGVSAARTPGPFQAQWSASTVYTVRAQGNSVVSAQAVSNRTAVLSDGGLSTPKTVSVGGLPTDWSTAAADDQSIAARIAAGTQAGAERQLWKVWVPLVLATFALACIVVSWGSRRVDAEQERRSAAYDDSRQPVA
jgi:high-affinity iron transporter